MEIFLLYALIAAILASIACGIIGPFVVVRKISYVAGGISHTALAGIGIACFVGFSPIFGALIAALIAAIIIGWISLGAKKNEDTMISALWAIGMAIGVIFIAKTPGFATDLMSYLFGNILLLSRDNLYLLAALDGIIIVLILLFYQQLQAVIFDSEFAALRGVKVHFYYLLLLSMVALTVISLIQVVGLILVLALLVMPAAIAERYAKSITAMMAVSVILSIVFSCAGLGLAYLFNLPAGAMIILLSGTMFFLFA